MTDMSLHELGFYWRGLVAGIRYEQEKHAMPHETTTTWTCSRCGGQEVTEGTDRPKNWSEISYRLLRGRDTDAHTIGELCNPCGGDHYSWVQGDDEQIERDRQTREQIAALETAEP